MTKPMTHVEVPEFWKHPYGPYRQAPEQYGGEWWYVSPFTAAGTTDNAAPWERFDHEPEVVTLPDGFVAIFGEMPEFKDFPNSAAWRIARDQWNLDLKRFKGAGRPLWVSQEKEAQLGEFYEFWGMGEPRFYGGRYGEMVRWPDSAMPDFEQAAYTAVEYPHQVVAMFQVDLIQMGVEITGDRHPFVPPHLFDDESEEAEEVE